MNDREQRKQAKLFSQHWSDDKLGGEKQDTLPFWFQLLSQVFGVDSPSSYMQCEVPVPGTGFIDGLILDTKVLIEQKSRGIALNKLIKQSDGSDLTPCEQAKRYANCLPLSQKPRWIVTCNFDEFWVYDQEKPNDQPVIVELKNLERDYQKLSFLVDERINEIAREEALSIQAGELVGRIYELIRAQYSDKTHEAEVDRSLNILCVRLVFCLYAEDAGLFGGIHKFHDFLKYTPVSHVREALIKLFKMLDTKEADRDPYEDETLLSFPYVNGGLFTDDTIIIPRLTQEIIDLLINDASSGFDWKDISPTIFGSVFESTLNPETRRKGGMHYTSVQNIHKVIDPLFMNELREEFNQIVAINTETTKMKRLKAFTEKLGSLTFLDPACGSGNFLTETFLSLRKLENDALRILTKGQGALFFTEDMTPINVGIHQFYGIEINDFAVTVAKTALWIAENQMMQRTEDIVQKDLDFLPLKSYPNIVEGNALRKDWNDVVPKEKLNFIMGNPPFVGTKYQSKEQKEDVLFVNPKLKPTDYVSSWFYKSALMCKDSLGTKAALVSTNSITQGEQVEPIWDLLLNKVGVSIDFAHKTFRWDSEANSKAQVHCVIIGFSSNQSLKSKKVIFDATGEAHPAKNINPYLMNGPSILVPSRTTPISNVQKLSKGSQPTDGGFLLLSLDEKIALEDKYPQLAPYIKRYMGASDLLHNTKRYCFWFKKCSDKTILGIPEVLERLKGVKISRLQSKKKSTQSWSKKPMLFTEDRQPESDYLILPVVSSENRPYLPIMYVTKDVIANANAQMLPNASLYEFGVLSSKIHMLWLKITCGRMKSDFAYSIQVVYNNFPWPNPNLEQKSKIEESAKEILRVREETQECLAELYGEKFDLVYTDLQEAHWQNDRLVMEAYGFSADMTEEDIVAELFKLYEKKVKEVEEAELKAKEEEKARKKADAST